MIIQLLESQGFQMVIVFMDTGRFEAWKVLYSDPPNTEPWSVFGLDLMPVPGIWKPDHLKSGQKCPVASIDRFTNKGHKKYFIHAKTV